MFIIDVVLDQEPRAMARDLSSFILAPVALVYSGSISFITSISPGCVMKIVMSSAYATAVVVVVLCLTFIPWSFESSLMRSGFTHNAKRIILSGHPCRTPLAILIGVDVCPFSVKVKVHRRRWFSVVHRRYHLHRILSKY